MGAMLGRSHNLFEELQREEEAREATAARRREKEGEQQQTMIQTTKSEEGNKLCDKCGKSRAMLIRCQIDRALEYDMRRRMLAKRFRRSYGWHRGISAL